MYMLYKTFIAKCDHKNIKIIIDTHKLETLSNITHKSDELNNVFLKAFSSNVLCKDTFVVG